MRHVILPQAIRRVIPPLMNDMVSLQKDVALVSLIGPIEILRQASKICKLHSIRWCCTDFPSNHHSFNPPYRLATYT
jgi:ABC-type arginine transport system permease subunit